MRLDEAGLVQWGERVGEMLTSPAVIGLVGPLGAGKSVLARAIGAGAGVRQAMPSPSFNLLFRYEVEGGPDLVHLDLYRLKSPDELWELGWGELGAANEIVLVEWPDRAGDLMLEDRWVVELEIPPGKPLLRDVSARRVGSPPPLAAFPLSVHQAAGS
jgi:tRNA threonylcarbamoyl adenosine modification protein YjeE